jgi:hypothetical protein
MLTEHIYASPMDGQWWYWWSWAGKITPVTDASHAAEAITRVLRSTDAGGPSKRGQPRSTRPPRFGPRCKTPRRSGL